jgi:hypothetical protein
MRFRTPLLVTGLAVLFCVLRVPLPAQTITFEAAVDRTTVGVGEQFTLSFTLTGPGVGGGKNLQMPELSKFHIMSGPNQSTSMQIVNGAVSSTATYSYILQPREVGKITIGSASIEAGGAVQKSAPITIEIVKGATHAGQQQAVPGDQTVQLGDNLFLRAVVDRTKVLQGEQVNLVFKLYTRVSVINYSVTKNPTMTGFWSEDVEIPKNITLTSEAVNGKSYKVGVIKKLALFPTQAGRLEIGPMDVQTTVQLPYARSNDPFEAFFRDPFGKSASYTVTSPPVTITVEPLPPGAPDDFKGAIGQFAMSTSIDKKTARTNEPVSLKVTVSGSGNIKLLESPQITVPPDFERYSPKVTESINRSQGKITGSKTFEHLMIPRYPGLKVIKAITLSYFDPSKRAYIRLRAPQIELNVEQGVASPVQTPVGVSREDVQLLSQDIRFIKVTNPTLFRTGEKPYASPLFLVLIALPLLGVAGAFVYARQRQVVMLDQAGYRYRKAITVAQKGLRQAEYLMKEKSGQAGEPSSKQRLRFYAEVSRALWKYLGDKMNIPQAAFSVERAVADLHSRGVPSELLQSLRAVLETCDLARFAPTSLELAAMQKTYAEARRVIVELERTLRGT